MAIHVSVGLILASALVLSGNIMSRADEPKFKIEETIGDIQIRRYDPMILAQVVIKGARKFAIREGFVLIADYIFGNNESKKASATGPSDKNPNKSEKISMTAPVLQYPQEAYSLTKKEITWTVSFVMPQTYTLDTLPKPNNSEIKIVPVPSKRFVVIRFSGLASDDSIKDHLDRLILYVTEHKIKVRGEPLFAFYNPPWTLPILRRNEIMLEIVE